MSTKPAHHWKDQVLQHLLPGGFANVDGAAGCSASNKLPQIAANARGSERLDAATTVEDLRVPPGHRLHKLSDDRAGQWSISVNDQFRICFVWGDYGPEQVEFVDYH